MKKLILIFTVLCVSHLHGMEEPKTKELAIYKSLASEEPGIQEIINGKILEGIEDKETFEDMAPDLKRVYYLGQLPKEQLDECVKNSITAMFSDTDTDTFLCDDEIGALKGISYLLDISYDTQKKFVDLMNILSKISNRTRESIARAFNTPTANEYIKLGNNFIKTVFNQTDSTRALKSAEELLDKGTDPSFSRINELLYNRESLISCAYVTAMYSTDTNAIALLKLLLNRGAKPEADFMEMMNHWMTEVDHTELNTQLVELLQQAAENK